MRRDAAVADQVAPFRIEIPEQLVVPLIPGDCAREAQWKATIGCLAAGASLGLGGGRVAGVVVHHVGLGTDRVYIHIEVEGGPAVGVWEIRHEPRLLHPGEGEPEPGKWMIMLLDGGVHFAEAEGGPWPPPCGPRLRCFSAMRLPTRYSGSFRKTGSPVPVEWRFGAEGAR